MAARTMTAAAAMAKTVDFRLPAFDLPRLRGDVVTMGMAF